MDRVAGGASCPICPGRLWRVDADAAAARFDSDDDVELVELVDDSEVVLLAAAFWQDGVAAATLGADDVSSAAEQQDEVAVATDLGLAPPVPGWWPAGAMRSTALAIDGAAAAAAAAAAGALSTTLR